LAALVAVPLHAFPQRDLLVFCGYVVVLVTLVGQGLTFAPLLRWLKLGVNATEVEQLNNEARLASVEAGLDTVDRLLEAKRIGTELAAVLRANLAARADRYEARSAALLQSGDGDITWPQDYRAAVEARRAIVNAQRAELVRWRDAGRLPDASLRKLRRELDHEERTLLDL
ncbi:MAG TPA: sodium:proton antiporter, partial [Kribbella sp.]|nr:sodium:proton antiporter [Kribbella sp.]